MDIDNYFKIREWHDSSIGQSTAIQQLNKKDLHYPIQIKHKIGEDMLTLKMAHISFVALTSIIQSQLFVFVFRMNSIASGNYLFFNSIIGNNNGNTAKFITFYKPHSGIGLLISTSYNGTYVSVANDDSTLIGPDYKFPPL